ncbi:hypothetical protein SAMN02799624_00627 [Paenibacillus sp. UNC496MF]|uniref:hypothetical protein n=1 Tax=Paenibacillus sp. UNC496MF TaxID=1502753 RepID=UPI0008E5DAA3|nr:hypothetical protein [Paenibacillus sp. UNC496MF]SFI36716.1 hypothetical protein SAMN02799624_00627 [Paenibacillus sp. UNC496MF]
MTTEQESAFRKTVRMLKDTTDAMSDYWTSYSNLGTWQFWLLLVLLIVPLIVLCAYLDRSKALLIGFYGLNVHAWFHYSDLATTTHGLTNYPYKFMPFLPVGLALDTSIVPVTYMLLYQWTVNRGKSYYLYAVLMSALFAFVVKPVMVSADLFAILNGMNYVYLFLLYVAVVVVAKLITDLFVYAQKRGRADERDVRRARFGRFGGREKAK